LKLQKKKELKKKRKAETNNKANRNDFTLGMILIVKGIGESITRDDLKEFFTQYGSVKYVEFQEGEKKAFIRFSDPSHADASLKDITTNTKEIGKK